MRGCYPRKLFLTNNLTNVLRIPQAGKGPKYSPVFCVKTMRPSWEGKIQRKIWKVPIGRLHGNEIFLCGLSLLIDLLFLETRTIFPIERRIVMFKNAQRFLVKQLFISFLISMPFISAAHANEIWVAPTLEYASLELDNWTGSIGDTHFTFALPDNMADFLISKGCFNWQKNKLILPMTSIYLPPRMETRRITLSLPFLIYLLAWFKTASRKLTSQPFLIQVV